MLVGRVPFDGNTIVEIFEAHLHDDPTPPAELVADCPADLSDSDPATCWPRTRANVPPMRPSVRAALVDILHDRPMQLAERPADDPAADLRRRPIPRSPISRCVCSRGPPRDAGRTFKEGHVDGAGPDCGRRCRGDCRLGDA